jgi:hypothetical protein
MAFPHHQSRRSQQDTIFHWVPLHRTKPPSIKGHNLNKSAIDQARKGYILAELDCQLTKPTTHLIGI